ncbi:hypothetical protein E2L07_10790 [Halalkalibacterium halodurans]|uniref:hypothetical protein n=1 Tax=Halalkalibacterium halodurans TaxID=86665 RepID=UPI001100F6FC|nr:hypothetical protein [Halalkalibacterium halodurans]TES54330.1 hypothetical protein E2L07_10790 [Halalkalibacterium halodurans]
MMETFDFLRPVYYLITLFLVCNYLYLTLLREKVKSSIYVFINSIFFTVIGLVLLFQSGVIVFGKRKMHKTASLFAAT